MSDFGFGPTDRNCVDWPNVLNSIFHSGDDDTEDAKNEKREKDRKRGRHKQKRREKRYRDNYIRMKRQNKLKL